MIEITRKIKQICPIPLGYQYYYLLAEGEMFHIEKTPIVCLALVEETDDEGSEARMVYVVDTGEGLFPVNEPCFSPSELSNTIEIGALAPTEVFEVVFPTECIERKKVELRRKMEARGRRHTVENYQGDEP